MTPTLWQIRLHWLTAVLFLAQLLLGTVTDTAFEARERGFALTGAPMAVAVAHASLGAAIAATVLARLWLRRRAGGLPVPPARPRWARRLAALVQGLLYALFLAIPAAGALAWAARSGVAAAVHETLIRAALALLALHVAGALAEQFAFRTGALSRMLGRRDGSV